MTAYGRSSVTTPIGRFTVEIQSINRKYLDVQLSLPPDLQRYDPDIRKLVSSLILRGQLSIKIYAYFEGDGPVQIKVNLPLAKQLKSALDDIKKELHIEDTDILPILAAFPNLLSQEQQWDQIDQCRTILLKAVEEALQELIVMRIREGTVLEREIKERLSLLSRYIDQIAAITPGTTEKYRQKLMQRMEQILPDSIDNEERIIREVALYAERINIDEEITRFRSHLLQANGLLESDKLGIGKTFEFLLQELSREINTIGSKAQDIDVSRIVVEAKGELEKVREQIQNIE